MRRIRPIETNHVQIRSDVLSSEAVLSAGVSGQERRQEEERELYLSISEHPVFQYELTDECDAAKRFLNTAVVGY